MADVQARRPEHASIEVCFRWIELDKDIAGGVLGGGLAYRFFFWTLSLSLLTAGGLASRRARTRMWRPRLWTRAWATRSPIRSPPQRSRLRAAAGGCS